MLCWFLFLHLEKCDNIHNKHSLGSLVKSVCSLRTGRGSIPMTVFRIYLMKNKKMICFPSRTTWSARCFFSFQFNRQFALPGLFTILSGAWPCGLPPTKCSQPSWHLWMLCHCQLSICGWHGLPCLSLQPQGIHIFNSSASLVLWVSGGRDSSLKKAGPPLPAEHDLGMHRIIDSWGLGGLLETLQPL